MSTREQRISEYVNQSEELQKKAATALDLGATEAAVQLLQIAEALLADAVEIAQR